MQDFAFGRVARSLRALPNAKSCTEKARKEFQGSPKRKILCFCSIARVLLYFPRYFGTWRSLVARLLWEQDVAGSNPVVPTSRGCGSMVELKPSKLLTRVRFPSPAPLKPQVRVLSALTFFCLCAKMCAKLRAKSERNFRPCCFERCIPGPACSAAQ